MEYKNSTLNCGGFTAPASFNQKTNPFLILKKTSLTTLILFILLFSIFPVNSEDTTPDCEGCKALSSFNQKINLEESKKTQEPPVDQETYQNKDIEKPLITGKAKETEIAESSSNDETILIEINKVVNNTQKIEGKSEDAIHTKSNESQISQNKPYNSNYQETESYETNLENKTLQEIEGNLGKISKPMPVETPLSTTPSQTDKKVIKNNSTNKTNNEKTRYINIDQKIEGVAEDFAEEKTKLICFKNSEKAFEGELNKNIDCSQIEKQETEENNKKQIIIKSDQHIEDPLTVYTNIPEITENQKSNVKIYWKNNDQEITSISFYDKNNNDLFDQISWTVPHLSEQIFEIIINFTTEDSSQSIEFELNSPKDNIQVTNPLLFNYSINYQNINDINCSLIIQGPKNYEIVLQHLNNPLNYELGDGNYSWFIQCNENSTPLPDSNLAHFSINEGYSVSNPDKVYLLGKEDVSINFSSTNNSLPEIKLIKPDNSWEILSPNQNTITINKNKLIETGLYKLNITFLNLAERYTIEKNFSVANMYLNFSEQTIEDNEEISIFFNISSPIEKILFATLYFGDNTEESFTINSNGFSKTKAHSYSDEGDYLINLTAIIDEKIFQIQKNGIHVTSSKDASPPEIELINPKNNQIINNTEVTFTYKAIDNQKIDNCTFELYNYSGKWQTLDYSETHSAENNKLKEIKLTNFIEGKYSWDIYCCDNSSNCNHWSDNDRDFTISFSDNVSNSLNIFTPSNNETYEQKEEIEKTISDLEDFLIKKRSYDLDQIESLNELGILKNLNEYEKKLKIFRTDFSTDLNSIKNESLRETRKKEILKEFSEIKEKIPSDLSIISKNEFVKNGITNNLEEIIKNYLEAQEINKINVKKLANFNYELQKNIKVLTKVKKIEIKYPEETKQITLITKKIEFNENKTDGMILEIIPKEINEEIVFLNENRIIKENEIYAVSPDKLKDGKLIYYVEKPIDSKEIEKTETILFKDLPQEFGITGYFVYFENIRNIGNKYYSIALIIFLAIIVYLIFIYTKKFKIKKWKKDENVKQIFKLKAEIKENEIENIKERYNKIKKLYPLIPKKCKKYLFKDLKKIKTLIDKKEVFQFIKEYNLAKKEKRINDSRAIYQKIKQKYNNLPKKYKEKVYNKIFKTKQAYEEL